MVTIYGHLSKGEKNEGNENYVNAFSNSSSISGPKSLLISWTASLESHRSCSPLIVAHLGGPESHRPFPLMEVEECIFRRKSTVIFVLPNHLDIIFPKFRVGLLQGRLPTEEKEKTMAEFQAGTIPILVGTTVIEVGVDVPNATVMVVQQGERFGLAQLHQLRGRVGRGRRQSYCLLLTSRKQTEAARQRLAFLERTHNGFEIAEMDLRLRGPGEFMGTRQSGLPALRVANLIRDQEILEKARRAAADFVEHGDRRELAHLVSYIKESWNRRYGLVTVG